MYMYRNYHIMYKLKLKSKYLKESVCIDSLQALFGGPDDLW